MEGAKHKVGFVFDNDGCLTIWPTKTPLPGAKQTLDYLTKNNIPYLLLTNNLAKTEQIFAEKVSDILKL